MNKHLFNVAGAGKVCVGNEVAVCGDSAGLFFSVSWGDNGINTGGVIGFNEARRMAEFILEKCNAETRPEKEIVKKALKKAMAL